MSKALENSCYRLVVGLQSLSPVIQNQVDEILQLLSEVANLQSHELCERELRNTRKYLERRLSIDRDGDGTPRDIFLDVIRSKSSMRFKYSPRLLRRVQPLFWKFLERNCQYWESAELAHLLSYAMRMKVMEFGRGDIAARGIVRISHEYFKALPVEDRDEVFLDLLEMFKAEPSFRRAVREEAESR